MTDLYTLEQQRLQESFGTQQLATAHKTLIVTDDIPEDHAAFIASRDFFFLSTVNDRGDEEGQQPLPAWKRIDDLQPILPEADRGRAETEGGTITSQEYMERVQRGEP